MVSLPGDQATGRVLVRHTSPFLAEASGAWSGPGSTQAPVRSEGEDTEEPEEKDAGKQRN